MADNVKPTFPKSDVKSGLENEQYADKVLDGVPGKKNVEEIDRENSVKLLKGKVTPRS